MGILLLLIWIAFLVCLDRSEARVSKLELDKRNEESQRWRRKEQAPLLPLTCHDCGQNGVGKEKSNIWEGGNLEDLLNSVLKGEELASAKKEVGPRAKECYYCTECCASFFRRYRGATWKKEEAIQARKLKKAQNDYRPKARVWLPKS